MADLRTLGKIAPTTAGTPVQCTTDNTIRASEIIVSQIAGTAGKTCFGRAGLNRTTLTGVIKQFIPPNAGGFLDTLEFEAEGNGLRLSDYWVDSDNNNEGVLVAYVVS